MSERLTDDQLREARIRMHGEHELQRSMLKRITDRHHNQQEVENMSTNFNGRSNANMPPGASEKHISDPKGMCENCCGTGEVENPDWPEQAEHIYMKCPECDGTGNTTTKE